MFLFQFQRLRTVALLLTKVRVEDPFNLLSIWCLAEDFSESTHNVKEHHYIPLK